MSPNHLHPLANEIAREIGRGFSRALMLFAAIVLGSQLLVLLALR